MQATELDKIRFREASTRSSGGEFYARAGEVGRCREFFGARLQKSPTGFILGNDLLCKL